MRVYEERFTFGKYDDVPLADVPCNYLKWFVENFDNPEYDLLCAVEAEQKRRRGDAEWEEEANRLTRQTPEGRARLTSAALQDFFSNAPARQSRQFRPKR